MMKSPFYCLFAALFGIVVSGCHSAVTSELRFPATDSLRLFSEFVPEDASFVKPEEIWAKDSLVLIMTSREEHFFHLYHRDGKHLRSFGKRGEGPNDLLQPLSFRLADDVLSVFDRAHSRQMACSLSTALHADKEVAFSSRSMPSFVGDVLEASSGHTYFLGDTHGMIGRLQGADTVSYVNYPVEYAAYPPIVRYLLFQGLLKQRPGGNQLLLATSRFGYLHFLEADRRGEVESVKRYFSEKPLFEDTSRGETFSVALKKENKNGYNAVAATSTHVYALYNGRTAAEPRSYFANRVRVFDWQGTPLNEFILEKDAWSIHVDEEQRLLYAISYGDMTTNEPVHYYVYRLPALSC